MMILETRSQRNAFIAAICGLILLISYPCCAYDQEVVPEPWRSIIKKLIASEDKKIQEKMKVMSAKDYAELRDQTVSAERKGDLNKLHWIGTRFNIMAAIGGRTEAYGDAISVFIKCLRKDPSFALAKWGLAFTYYNLAISSIKPVKMPSGLYVFPLDERGAELMIEVYRLANAAVQGGYGPSDPNVLEMSRDKLLAYCRTTIQKPTWCRELY